MCSGFEKIDRLERLATILLKEVRAGDKIIIQFDEMFVFHGDFSYTDFMEQMEQLILDLVQDNKAKRIILCTIPPNRDHLDDQVYRASLKKISKGLWDQRDKLTKQVFICDLYRHFTDWYDAKSGYK